MGGEWGWIAAAAAAAAVVVPARVPVADAEPVITGNKIKHGQRFPCGWDERDAKV